MKRWKDLAAAAKKSRLAPAAKHRCGLGSCPAKPEREPDQQQKGGGREPAERAHRVPRATVLELRLEPGVGRVHPDHQHDGQAALHVHEIEPLARLCVG